MIEINALTHWAECKIGDYPGFVGSNGGFQRLTAEVRVIGLFYFALASYTVCQADMNA